MSRSVATESLGLPHAPHQEGPPVLRVLAVATEGTAGVFQSVKQWAAQADVELDCVAELPLARRVIHERQEPHMRALHQLLGFRHHQRHRHLAAQMQEVLDA